MRLAEGVALSTNGQYHRSYVEVKENPGVELIQFETDGVKVATVPSRIELRGEQGRSMLRPCSRFSNSKWASLRNSD